MTKRKTGLALGGTLLALAAAGCVMPFNGPAGAKRDVQRMTGRDYDRTFALTVGRSGLALVRWAAREGGEEELPIKGLRKVEIGFYEVRDGGEAAPGGAGLGAEGLPGWFPMVELHPGGGENVLILSQARSDGSIRRLLFVVESEEELVIVRLKGRLDRFIEEAVRYAFQQAERPDLASPSLEEYRRRYGNGAGT